MKKFISAVIAVSLCACMLAACGNNVTNDENSTESLTSAETESELVSENTSSADGETADTEKAETGSGGSDSAASAEFDSFDDLEGADISELPFESVSSESSLTYAFFSKHKDANEIYIDVSAVYSNMQLTFAVAEDNVAMRIYDAESGINQSIVIKDKVMYMLDPSQKSGYYYAVDESASDDYSLDEMLGQLNIDSDLDMSDISSCAVKIGGTEYILEYMAENSKLIYDTNGELTAIVSEADGNAVVFIVNEFSSSVPADAFEVPSDYELVDFSEAFGQ